MPDDLGSVERAAQGEAKATRKKRTPPPPPEDDVPTGVDPEKDAVRLRNQQLQDQLEEARGMIPLRRDYADKIFTLTKWWLIVVIVLVVLSSISIPDRGSFWGGLRTIGFTLPEKALIAFITTTTLNVIALFLAVTGWLFPKAAAPEKKKKSSK